MSAFRSLLEVHHYSKGRGPGAEQSLLTPEIHGSNPIMGNELFRICQLKLRKDENSKEKEAGIGPFKRRFITISLPLNLEKSLKLLTWIP